MVIVDARPPEEGAERGQARLFVYQRNVERGAGSIAGLEAELAVALEREITAVFLDRDPREPLSNDEKHQLN
jgi:hypothetical protein